MEKNLNLKNISSLLTKRLQQVSRYGLVIFMLSVAGIYGFIFMQVENLNAVEPTEAQISAHHDPIKTARIDEKVVQQLLSLRDNNVNVQALFEQARNNPFQE